MYTVGELTADFLFTGRTARIGNEGLATSFYNDRDEGMRDFLVKILLETDQALPEFWEEFKPEDTTEIDFEDNSDDDEEEEDNIGSGDAWGNGDSGDNTQAVTGDAWGASNEVAAAPVVIDDWNVKPAKPVNDSTW